MPSGPAPYLATEPPPSPPFWARTALRLYRIASQLGTPLVGHLLKKRSGRGKEDPARIDERFGIAGVPRPEGRLLWIHAASVGEALSTIALIDRLGRQWPRLAILVTTGTVTSAQLMAKQLPPGVIHQFIPVDTAAAVDRFYNHWRPDLAFLVESEIWPNLLLAAQARDVDLVLINGRMSPRSFGSWSRVRPVIRKLLGCFSMIFAQSPEDEARFKDLGAPHTACVGNLKFAAPPLAADSKELQAIELALAARPRWLAASTHPGEEEVIAEAHGLIKQQHPDIVTILAPRHPNRGAEIAQLLAAQGLTVARRSQGEAAGPDTDIYLADTLGEMGLWFRAAEVVFLGGTFAPIGGHNPLEPAKLNCAVLFGPDYHNFQQIGDEMTAAGGLRVVADPAELAATVTSLLGDPKVRNTISAAGRRYALAHGKVLDRLIDGLAHHLDGKR